MVSTNAFGKLASTIAVVLLCGCGGDSEPSVKHLTSVADPDPQTPFFNDTTMQSLSVFGDATTSWMSDVSKIMALDTTEFASTPSARARSVMATDQSLVDCGSGSISARGLDNPQNFRATISFNNCKNDGVIANGSIGISGSMLESAADSDDLSANVKVTFNNLTISGQESASINGDLSIDVIDNAQQLELSMAGNALTTIADGQTNTLSNYEIAMTEISGESTLSLNMTLHSSEHGSIVFKTDSPLSGDAFSDNPTSGSFTMTHSDGSYLSVDANNGDPDTFAYTIFNGSSITSGNSNWTELEFIDSL